MRSRIKVAAAAMLLGLSLTMPARENRTGVYTEPAAVAAGEPVRIFGYVQPGTGPVALTITLLPPPPHRQQTIPLTSARDGSFELLFHDTKIPGTWRVRAARRGNPPGETTFTVTTGVFAAETAAALREVNQVAGDGAGGFKNTLSGYPEFPGKEKMLGELEELENRINEMATHLETLAAAAKQLEAQLRLHGGSVPEDAARALRQAADSCRDAATAVRNGLPPIRAALDSTRESAEWCHVWLGYHEFCELLGNLNKLVVTSLTSAARKLAMAAALSRLHPALQQAIKTVVHLLTTSKPSVVGFSTYMIGTLASLGADTYSQLMKTCTYYRGTAEGSYHLALEHKGKPFFVMNYRLDGEVWLSFEARKPGDPAVHLRGRLRGKARDFACDLTMTPFALPGTAAPAFCHCPVPPLGPRHCLIYFTGTAMDDRMELELDKVHSDFNLKAVGFYVLLSPHIIGLEADFLEFPLMDGEWFLTRVTRLSQPGTKHFTLPVSARGDHSVAQKTFTREIYLPPTAKRKAVRVNMTLKFKLCSPECE